VSEAPAIETSEQMLRDDLAGAPFSAGADRDYWRLVTLQWPLMVIEVAAAERLGAPSHYALLFDLSGYPQAPTAQFWDLEANAQLPPERWPTGGPREQQAFNPTWRPDALYLPVDRHALQGHDAWLVQHAAHVWDPARDITQYLRMVYDLLQGPSYTGVRGG
jgi:hypothetical protein